MAFWSLVDIISLSQDMVLWPPLVRSTFFIALTSHQNLTLNSFLVQQAKGACTQDISVFFLVPTHKFRRSHHTPQAILLGLEGVLVLV